MTTNNSVLELNDNPQNLDASRGSFDDENMDEYFHQRRMKDSLQEYTKKNLRKVRILLAITIIIVLCVILTIIAILLVPRIINYMVSRNLSCSFTVVMTGVGGGLTEENLSGILISKGHDNRFLAIDPGSLLYGLRRFIQEEGLMYSNYASSNMNMYFPFPSFATREIQRAGYLLRNHIFGYFIGHSHLDHFVGLVLNSPQDYFDGADGTSLDMLPKSKSLIGLADTLSTLQDDVFNNKLWPNIPQITGRYIYQTVDVQGSYPVNQLLSIPVGSPYNEYFKDMTVKFFDTCHGEITSTAFLFTSHNNNGIPERQILYLSDTGVSTQNMTCDWRSKLKSIWSNKNFNVAIVSAIFIEISLQDGTPDQQMFGHLRPSDLMIILQDLSKSTGVTDLSKLKIVIQHIKQSFDAGDDPKEVIGKQVMSEAAKKAVNAQFLFPSQGAYLCL